MTKVGTLIRNYRKRVGMSQIDLEVAIGAATGSVSRFESGKVNPTKYTVEKLAQVLKLNPIETLKLHGINTSYFDQLVSLTDGLHNSNDLDELIKKCTDDINKFFPTSVLQCILKKEIKCD